jgi:hypothetical protein
LYLYDSSVNPVDVGERNAGYMRVSRFFNQRIDVNHFTIVWVDDDASLATLMQRQDYQKMSILGPDSVQDPALSINSSVNELVCEFKDFYLYNYYRSLGGINSPASTMEEASILRSALYQHVENNLNTAYDDGKFRFYVHETR